MLSVARLLPLSDSGLFAIGYALLCTVAPLCLVGSDQALLRFIGVFSHNGDTNQIQGYGILSFFIVLVISSIFALALYSSSDYVANHFWKNSDLQPVFEILSPTIVFFALSSVIAYALQGASRMIGSVIVLNIFLPMLVSIIIVMTDVDDVITIFRLMLAVSIVNLVIACGIWFNTVGVVSPVFPSLKKYLKTCIPLWITTGLTVFMYFGVQLLSAIWISSEDSAALAASQRVSSVCSFILISVNLAIAPKFASLKFEGRVVELKNLARKTTVLMIFLSSPLLFSLLFYPQEVMGIFGDSYTAYWLLLIVLSIGQLFNVATGSVGILLAMSGYEKDLRSTSILAAFVVTISVLIFVPVIGVLGSVVSMTLGLIVQNFSNAILVKKRLGFYSIGKFLI